jgi:hypothetical protein
VYKRTASVITASILLSNEPEAEELKRLDYASANDTGATLYTYTAVPSNYTVKETEEYGTLLDEGGETTLYQLRQGINIIQVDNSCTLELYADNAGSDIAIVGNLDIIFKEEGHPNASLNPKLDYKPSYTYSSETEAYSITSAYDQVLKDIKAVDTNYLFYYNTIVQNALGIDMNDLDETDILSHNTN